MNDSYREVIHRLAGLYATKYQQNPKRAMEQFDHLSAPVKVLKKVYSYFIFDGILEPLEKLPIETKNKLWNEVKSAVPGIEKEKAILLCKSLCAINLIIESVGE